MSKDLELYKFCEDKEMSWYEEELIIWIDFYDLQEFTDMIGYDYLCEGGIEVRLQKDCVAFDLVPICEYIDIDPTDIFEKED